MTTAGQQDLPARDITVIRVTGANITSFREPMRAPVNHSAGNPPPVIGRYSYRVGVGDTIRVTFFADPAGVTSPTEFAPETVAVIDESGRFFYPFLGTVQAEGRTVGDVRADLTERLGEFFATPQVEVAVVEFNARRVTITGAVGAQGQQVLTNVPTTLLDLVNIAVASPDADLSRVELRRRGEVYTANLLSFLEQGTPQNNPILLPDDFIRVPIAEENKVFTFGEISTGEIRLDVARKTLLEVLAEAGGIDRIRADARGIFVFRRDDPARVGFDVYQFNLSNAAALVLAAEFGMAPLDIVFVTNDPATRWNDTITKIIGPFNTLVSAQTTAEQVGQVPN
ncbi:MAG: polysaccharide biosynthesis/export family protein [Pseudomonadota bacterium]